MSGPIALGHLELQTVPEYVTQPYAHGAIVVVLDGRIDNHAHLTSLLGMPGNAADPVLLVAAYRKWGTDVPRHVIGEFAFVLWDGTGRRLVCARDHLGIRPLLWARRGELLLVGSEIAQILVHPDVVVEPDESFVAELLRADIVSRDRTLAVGVQRLPPGHSLIVENGVISVRRYWWPELIEVDRSRSTEGWIDDLKSTLEAAVDCRLRTSGRVFTHASGGLDSSTVTSMAARAWERSGRPREDLVPMALVFDFPDADEALYIDAMSTHLRRPILRVPYVQSEAATPIGGDLAPAPNYFGQLDATVAERGGRVSLTGHGGDQWLTGEPNAILDLALRGRVLEARRRVGAFGAMEGFGGGWRWSVSHFGRTALGRYVPEALRRPMHRRDVPRWVAVDLARRTDLHRIRHRRSGGGFARAATLWLLDDGEHALSLEAADRVAAAYGVERRHPLHDRRLVELVLRMPPEIVWRAGMTRWAHRRAIRGIVPEAVRLRKGKADFGMVIARGLPMVETEAAIAALVAREWVVGSVASSMLDELHGALLRNASVLPHLHPLWAIRAIDSWLTHWVSCATVVDN